jgi:hypothetical protein
VKILLLGGYGGFGARIAKRLAANGHAVLVAGRSLSKATAFCAAQAGLTPMKVDRKEISSALSLYRPDLVVDAAGPFQGSDYAVPNACVAAGVHYLDIADGRDFVTGIASLDEEARAAGVVVRSGVSSVPALSGAVVRHLAEGMDDIRAVEMAISASNRATAGLSVAKAILSYVGKPVRLWRGRRWVTAYGWQEFHCEQFEIEAQPPLNRAVALAEIPDLELLPERLPGRPAVSFHAGADLAVQNLALWVLSWPVRWGWLKTLDPLSSLMGPLQRLSARLGGDRSAMIVRLFGSQAACRIERRWTLIAERGDGPEIPALAVPIMVNRIMSHDIAPGACAAGNELTLGDFDDVFQALAITHAIRDIPQEPCLYRRVMGERYDSLPASVRRIHDVLRDGGASGWATVVQGESWIARLVSRVVGFPSAGEHELHVHFTENEGTENWTRRFSGRAFRSSLRERDGLLVERFGPLSFAFELPSDEAGLTMRMRRWWLGPIPLPNALAPRSEAIEREEHGRFRFDVPIALPGVGLVVHYCGWLDAVN